jgi:enoyl-CoA hydratase/carnithine racemase
MSDRVVIETQDGIADVRLNRAEKMNALDFPMFQALAEAARELGSDRSVRAVVLSGEGRAFSAGLDMASFAAMAGGGERGQVEETLRPAETGSPANFAQLPAWAWQEVPVPVIAAVHGVAYGGGLQIALGADIRFVAPDARLSVMEVRWGLIPDMSGTQALRRLVPLDVAKELTFTGRIVSGTEAVELGLATRLADDPRAAAMEMAREIASKSPDAVRAAKELLNRSVWSTLEEGLALEEKIQRTLIGGPNQIESVKANLEKREPKYVDPA